MTQGQPSSNARLVIADASPLIGLATAGVFALLESLFGRVTITDLVKNEVMRRRDRPGSRELDAAMRAGWIRVARAPLETWRFAELDAGEASTLALAQRHEDSLVLMDDAVGRREAAALGLETLDLAGLLAEAKRAGLVDTVQPLLSRLTRGGFTLPEDVRSRLLDDAEESGEPSRG